MRMRLSMMFLAAMFAACESKTEKLHAVGETSTPTVQAIKEAPRQYVGRTVTVVGEIKDVLGDHAFEIEGDGLLTETRLLVLTKSAVKFGPTALRNTDSLVVHGRVEKLPVAELERELGQDLPAILEKRYSQGPVLVADSVRLVETGFRWSEDMREGAIVSFLRIVSELAPRTLAGTNVELGDIVVQAKTGRGLWIGPTPRFQLFVVPSDASMLAGIVVGDRVDVHGKVREMPTRAEAVKQFALDPATAAPIAREDIYIDASEVKKSTPPPAS